MSDLAVDEPHMADGLDNVTRAGLAFRANHRRAFGDSPQGLSEVARAAHEGHGERGLVDMVDVVGRAQDLRLVYVVYLDGLQDLRFGEMPNAALRHDGNAHGVLDSANHGGIAHTADASRRPDVCRDALEGHDRAGPGFLGDERLLGRGHVHDDATFEHLG